MKCMGLVWYNIPKNRPRWKRFFCAPGGGVDTFIFSDFEPWNFVIALYKISLCKSHCYSSWAFICSKVELLTRTWALNNFDRSYGPGILHNLLISRQYCTVGWSKYLQHMFCQMVWALSSETIFVFGFIQYSFITKARALLSVQTNHPIVREIDTARVLYTGTRVLFP